MITLISKNGKENEEDVKEKDIRTMTVFLTAFPFAVCTGAV